MNSVSAERLQHLFRYCPATGKIFCKHEHRGGFKRSVMIHRPGDEAGCTRPDGRRVIRVDGSLLMAYRVAWALHHGELPDGEIDHINGDHADNRAVNLRLTSRQVNQQNIRRAQRSKRSSKFLGVHRNKPGRKKPWRSVIQVAGKQINVGYFFSEEEAYRAYVTAKRRHHAGCTL